MGLGRETRLGWGGERPSGQTGEQIFCVVAGGRSFPGIRARRVALGNRISFGTCIIARWCQTRLMAGGLENGSLFIVAAGSSPPASLVGFGFGGGFGRLSCEFWHSHGVDALASLNVCVLWRLASDPLLVGLGSPAHSPSASVKGRLVGKQTWQCPLGLRTGGGRADGWASKFEFVVAAGNRPEKRWPGALQVGKRMLVRRGGRHGLAHACLTEGRRGKEGVAGFRSFRSAFTTCIQDESKHIPCIMMLASCDKIIAQSCASHPEG